jgi:hypothetical protein
VNPDKFKAPILSKSEIEERVAEVRAEYPLTQRFPIDVLGFAEFDLGLAFDFAPIQQLGQDAFLLPDLTGIAFDTAAFKQPALKQRLRFSAAHELGHFFLHRDIYERLSFSTPRQWKAFISAIPAEEIYWIEWQADEFAGQFLIPTPELDAVLCETIADAQREGFFSLGEEVVLDFCSKSTKDHFGVSPQAMQTRIRKCNLWPPRNLSTNPN